MSIAVALLTQDALIFGLTWLILAFLARRRGDALEPLPSKAPREREPRWPPSWFASIRSDRDDTAARTEEIFRGPPARSHTASSPVPLYARRILASGLHADVKTITVDQAVELLADKFASCSP